MKIVVQEKCKDNEGLSQRAKLWNGAKDIRFPYYFMVKLTLKILPRVDRRQSDLHGKSVI